jgi:A/G-specific adenine glycosylase
MEISTRPYNKVSPASKKRPTSRKGPICKNSSKKLPAALGVPAPTQSVLHLSQWFESAHRDLPWRRTRDPYRIWISEIMLQQTQVATVLPYYEKFLAAFPTVQSLAEAPTERVLELWSGLGYYSRARNLQKGARYLLEHHAGIFPKSRTEVLHIPGIGPYTAGAILSIAFDLAVPIVDGNVQRVLTRFYGWKEPLEQKSTLEWLWNCADAWVHCAESPRVINQAMMELGALVCRKDSPRCETCPLSSQCVALKLGIQATLPTRKARQKPVDLWWACPVLVHDGHVYLEQQPTGQWWEGLWSIPALRLVNETALTSALGQFCRDQNLLLAAAHMELGKIRHTVTHHRLHVLPVVMTLKSKPSSLTGKWFGFPQADSQALSSLARKVLRSSRSATLLP